MCRSKRLGGSRAHHLAEMARGLPITKIGGRGGGMQLADLLHGDVSGPDPASYLTPGVYSSFELIARTHGKSSSLPSLLCSLFSEATGLPEERIRGSTANCTFRSIC